MPSKKNKYYKKIKTSPKNIRYEEICNIARLFGFKPRGGKGSHEGFYNQEINIALNFQRGKDGKAKPYQVRQLIKIIEDFKLND